MLEAAIELHHSLQPPGSTIVPVQLMPTGHQSIGLIDQSKFAKETARHRRIVIKGLVFFSLGSRQFIAGL